jgi:molybdenum cofactor cytidylyltransferase
MRVIVCASAAQGMGRSLACGVAAAKAADGLVIALADMPYIRSDTIRRVLGRLHSGAEIVTPYYAGRRGHPVGFRHSLLDQLLSIEQHAARVSRLDVDDPGILRDIDYRADLDRLLLFPAYA